MNNQPTWDDRADKTVCVDFDGVIHWYRKGYQDGEIYDDPKPGSFQALKRLSDAGYRILIHTARRDRTQIESWMNMHFNLLDCGFPFEINTEKPAAAIYIDDNAFRLSDWEAQRMELASALKGIDRTPVLALDSILCQLRSHPLTAPWTDEQREGLAEHVLNNLATAAMLTGGLVKVSMW